MRSFSKFKKLIPIVLLCISGCLGFETIPTSTSIPSPSPILSPNPNPSSERSDIDLKIILGFILTTAGVGVMLIAFGVGQKGKATSSKPPTISVNESKTVQALEQQVRSLHNLVQKLQNQLKNSQTQASHQSDQIEALDKRVSLLQGLVANLHKQLESQTNDSPSPQINNPDPIQIIIDRFQTSPKDFFESGERIKALTPDQEPKLLTLTPQQASPVVLIRVSDRGGYLIPKPGYNTYTKFEPYFELEDDQFHGDLQLLEPAHVSPLRDRWMLEKKGKISFSSL